MVQLAILKKKNTIITQFQPYYGWNYTISTELAIQTIQYIVSNTRAT